MIYKNKSSFSPTTKEIIDGLCKHNVDLILIGGEAAELYNLYKSTNDIDFLMNPSEENIKNMYDYLSTMFNVSYEEFKSLVNGYRLISSEKPIEFLLEFSEPIIKEDVLRDPSSGFIFLGEVHRRIIKVFAKKSPNLSVFDAFNERAQYFKYYDNDMKVVNIEDYILYIKVYLQHIQDNIDSYNNKTKYLNKIDKYKKAISKYYDLQK